MGWTLESLGLNILLFMLALLHLIALYLGLSLLYLILPEDLLHNSSHQFDEF